MECPFSYRGKAARFISPAAACPGRLRAPLRAVGKFSFLSVARSNLVSRTTDRIRRWCRWCAIQHPVARWCTDLCRGCVRRLAGFTPALQQQLLFSRVFAAPVAARVEVDERLANSNTTF